jgi:nucleotide-binding universal stress UspA family protein
MTTAANHHGIVVGVDGSSASKAAVAWAARDAAWRKVPLTLVHVLLPPATMTWPEVPLPPGFQQWQEAGGRDIIRDATAIGHDATGPDSIEIDSEMVTGSAVACLADLSKNAQMVVVGRHGRGRLRHLLGAVSSGLTQHAHCPVAVIHDEEPPMPAAAFAPVVVGVDGSPASESATAIAFDEASRRGVDLVAVHACIDWGGWGYPEIDWPAVEPRARELLAERLSSWQARYPAVTVRSVVVANLAAERLLEESERAQLVVVGSHGRGGFAGMLLGSVSSAVVQSARTPVIVAREP